MIVLDTEGLGSTDVNKNSDSRLLLKKYFFKYYITECSSIFMTNFLKREKREERRESFFLKKNKIK